MAGSAAEIARKAAGIIRERGLAKHVLKDDEGRVCFNGALILATGHELRSGYISDHADVFDTPERKAVTDQAMGLLYRDGIRDIPEPAVWNNMDTTTESDVIHLLEMTAKHLEENERG